MSNNKTKKGLISSLYTKNSPQLSLTEADLVDKSKKGMSITPEDCLRLKKPTGSKPELCRSLIQFLDLVVLGPSNSSHF